MGRSTEWRGSIVVALLACLSLMVADAGSQQNVTVQQVAKRAYVISQRDANLVLMMGDDHSFVSGVMYAPLVARARALIDELKARPVRYALILEDDASLIAGDGGWGAANAVTLIHEKLYSRMYSASHGRKGKPPAIVLEHPAPALGFSEVVQVLLANEEIHIIHARAGYTDADVIVHLEGSGVVQLGHTVTTDGYPVIDTAREGDVNEMIATVEVFVAKAQSFPETVTVIVPGRGPVVKGDGLREYRDMLVTTRDRVLALIKEGKTLADVVAAKPSASFDAKWGKGPVSSDAFVTALYKSLSPK